MYCAYLKCLLRHFWQSNGRIAGPTGQAFQSLGEELSMADRTKSQYCSTIHGGTHREWYNGNVT